MKMPFQAENAPANRDGFAIFAILRNVNERDKNV